MVVETASIEVQTDEIETWAQIPVETSIETVNMGINTAEIQMADAGNGSAMLTRVTNAGTGSGLAENPTD